MQFTLLTFATLFAAAMAVDPRAHNAWSKRQAAQNSQSGVATNQPAMTNAQGEVVPFDAANVYLDSVAKGL